MKNNPNSSGGFTNQNSIILLRIIAIYQLVRGIFGQTLPVPLAVNLLFRLLLCSSGLLAFLNKKVGITLLILTLILSIPKIELDSFYWTPVKLFMPINIGFSLTLVQSVQENSASGSFLFGIDVVYVVLASTLKQLASVQPNRD